MPTVTNFFANSDITQRLFAFCNCNHHKFYAIQNSNFDAAKSLELITIKQLFKKLSVINYQSTVLCMTIVIYYSLQS